MASDQGSFLTGLRALLKGLLLIAVFPLILLIVSLADLVYAIIATILLLSIFLVFVTAIGFLVTGGQNSDSLYSQSTFQGINAVVRFGILADVVVIAVLMAISALTFVFGPVRLAMKLRERGEDHSPIALLSKQLARRLSTSPFARIYPGGGFFVSCLKAYGKKVLLCDPRLSEFLSPAELSAVLIHEYAHFQPGMSISYAFVRRCEMASGLLSNEFNGGDATFFARTIKFVTWPLPFAPLKESFRGLYAHLGRVISGTYSGVTRLFTRFSVRDFHEAEYFADRLAIEHAGQRPFCDAVVKVFSLQLIEMTKGEDFEEFWKRWMHQFDGSTDTHPSLRRRLLLASSDLANADYQPLVKSLWRSTAKGRPIGPVTRLEFNAQYLQALCLPQLASSKPQK